MGPPWAGMDFSLSRTLYMVPDQKFPNSQIQRKDLHFGPFFLGLWLGFHLVGVILLIIGI